MKPKRVYDLDWGCAHCEQEHMVRNDYLRGHICRHCDDAMDRMEREEPAETVEGGAL